MHDTSVAQGGVTNLRGTKRNSHIPDPQLSENAEGQAQKGRNSDSDDDPTPLTRAIRRHKPLEEAKPTNLRFYGGAWHDVLVMAKNIYRLAIHADGQNPFPERNDPNLDAAHDSLFEATNQLSREAKEAIDRASGKFNFFVSLYIVH